MLEPWIYVVNKQTLLIIPCNRYWAEIQCLIEFIPYTQTPVLDFLSANILFNSPWGFWVHSQNEIPICWQQMSTCEVFQSKEAAWKTQLKKKECTH